MQRSLLCALIAALALTGCGSSGGGGDGGGSASTLYVRASAGSDSNSGATPEKALRTITAALGRLDGPGTVIVGPGNYEESINNPASGSAARPLELRADPSGALTGDAPGEVQIDAGDARDTQGNRLPAIRLSRASHVIVDGFVVVRGNGSGIQVRSSSTDVTIRNCQISDASGDGILLQDSSQITLFNNLLYDNSSRGLVIAGTERATVVNNTIVRNRGTGIDVRVRNETESPGTFLRNNIVQANGGDNIEVTSGLDTYDAGFNIVFPDTYEPDTARRATDVNLDAAFIDATNDNFRLSDAAVGQPVTSPAVDGAVEQHPETGPMIDFAPLRELSTASDRRLDNGPLDMGYHYVPAAEIPPPRDPFLYVRASAGDDRNEGTSPDQAFRTLAAAAQRVADGDTIIVGPGVYRGRLIDPRGGTPDRPVTYLADPSGDLTGDLRGDVVLDNEGASGSVIRITGASALRIDGFVITGGSTAGIQIRGGATDLAIQNCQVTDTSGDGVLVQDSTDVLLFNNLVHDNTGRGIVVAGAPRTALINNTVTRNGGRGVFIGSRDVNGTLVPSTDGFLRNNIIQDNGGTNLQVSITEPSSRPGYDAAFNLVFPNSYSPSDLAADTDLNVDARFEKPVVGDFRLNQPRNRPNEAVDAGVEDSPPGGPPADFGALHARTTAPNGNDDEGAIDLGFHYPR